MWMTCYVIFSYVIGVLVGRWYQRRRMAGAVVPADNFTTVYVGPFTGQTNGKYTHLRIVTAQDSTE